MIECACKNCSGLFQAKPYEVKQGRAFCSPVCAHRGRRRRLETNCGNCGQVITPHRRPTRSYQKRYCNRVCMAADRRVTAQKACKTCGSVFAGRRSEVLRHDYCSVRCVPKRPESAARQQATKYKKSKELDWSSRLYTPLMLRRFTEWEDSSCAFPLCELQAVQSSRIKNNWHLCRFHYLRLRQALISARFRARQAIKELT